MGDKPKQSVRTLHAGHAATSMAGRGMGRAAASFSHRVRVSFSSDAVPATATGGLGPSPATPVRHKETPDIFVHSIPAGSVSSFENPVNPPFRPPLRPGKAADNVGVGTARPHQRSGVGTARPHIRPPPRSPGPSGLPSSDLPLCPAGRLEHHPAWRLLTFRLCRQPCSPRAHPRPAPERRSLAGLPPHPRRTGVPSWPPF